MRQARYPIPLAMRACSYRTQDRSDTLVVLKSIDQAGNLVSASTFANDPQFLRVDTKWLHIDKAESLIAGGMPALALEELDNVYQRGDPQARQRYFYAVIIEAEASLARGWADVGAVYLQEALRALNQTNSRRHLSHIVRIHDTLQENPPYRFPEDSASNVWSIGNALCHVLMYPCLVKRPGQLSRCPLHLSMLLALAWPAVFVYQLCWPAATRSRS